MAGQVEFYFDYVSPMSYFGFHRVLDLQARTGCEILWRPMFLGAVMKATGNRPPGVVEAKRNYFFVDTIRHAKRFDLPFTFNPHFPFDSRKALNITASLLEDEALIPFMKAMFHHSWGEPKNLSDEAVLRDVLTGEDFCTDQFMARADATENAEIISEFTKMALEHGIFGAPSFVVGNEMFFGQDRIDFVEDALTEKSWIR